MVIALLFALAYLTRDKKNASTPVDSVPTTTPISVAPSTVLGGSAGESSTTDEASTTTAVLAPFAYGKGGCPAADGSSIKQSKFTQAFKLCIDPAKKYTATFETSEGAIVVDLDTSDVPGTVNNFVTLARFHYYDGTSIFRADSSIDIIQGGGKSNGATPGYKIPDEKNGFTYSEGDLVMARTGEPNSAGSQWFFAGGPKVSNLATEGTYVRAEPPTTLAPGQGRSPWTATSPIRSHPDGVLTRAAPVGRATTVVSASVRVRCRRSADQPSASVTRARPVTSPRPMVNAPPRGSTIGSHSPSALPATATISASRSLSAVNAVHSGVSFSTDRRCSG